METKELPAGFVKANLQAEHGNIICTFEDGTDIYFQNEDVIEFLKNCHPAGCCDHDEVEGVLSDYWELAKEQDEYKDEREQGRKAREMILNGLHIIPGMYERHFITADGCFLCYECANENIDQCCDFICKTNWNVIGCETNDEDSDMHCSHCGRQILPNVGTDSKLRIVLVRVENEKNPIPKACNYSSKMEDMGAAENFAKCEGYHVLLLQDSDTVLEDARKEAMKLFADGKIKIYNKWRK
jgi:hypothetical protein